MPQWIEDEKDYKFRPLNEPYETRVNVSGVMDRSETQRPKLILEDRADNKGLSVSSDESARNQCIQSLSRSMKIEPHEADWFVREKGGNLKSVGIDYQQVTKTNPQFTDLVKSGELRQDEMSKTKKAFPDIQQTEVRSSLKDIEPNQQHELGEAYKAARDDKSAQKENKEDVSEKNQAKSAHEYDLSQERVRER